MTETEKNETEKSPAKKKKPLIWLVYLSILLSGLILLGDGFNWPQLDRWTARFGIALVFSAFAMVIANGKKMSMIATAIIWVAVLATYLV